MRALLVCLFLTLAAPAWACVDPGGIGGTGIGGEGGGIGGTGQRAEADVGLVGVVTGFASICVNGIEVHYEPGTPVSVNGEPTSTAALAVGKVVAVRAVGSGTQARARSIDIVDAAVGPVTSVEAPGTLVHVQGQRVRVDPSTVLGGGLTRERLAAASVGEPMRVSGLRTADGTIVATRIDAAAPGTRATVTDVGDPGLGRFVVLGYVNDVQGQTLRVGSTTFNAPSELGAQLPRDRPVRVTGRSEAGNRVVERADVLRGPFDVRPERVLRAQAQPDRDERRSDRRGRDDDRRDRDEDRRGRSGRDAERIDRVERSGRGGGDRPERIDRSGRR